MSTGPGTAGLVWLWDAVSSLRPGSLPEPSLRPAPVRDHDFGAVMVIAAPKS